MITNVFRKYMALQLENGASTYKGLLAATGTNGTTYYLANQKINAIAQGYTTNLTSTAGIALGSGTTAAAATDTTLVTPITSGISVLVTQSAGVASGAPYIQLDLVITNTGSSSVTIAEIGYIQKCYASTTEGGTSLSQYCFLWDRTLLSSAVTIPAGDSAAIRYTLKTEMT